MAILGEEIQIFVYFKWDFFDKFQTAWLIFERHNVFYVLIDKSHGVEIPADFIVTLYYLHTISNLKCKKKYRFSTNMYKTVETF